MAQNEGSEQGQAGAPEAPAGREWVTTERLKASRPPVVLERPAATLNE